MSLKKFAVVLMTASLVLNAACSSCKKNDAAAKKDEQVFVFANNGEPEYLDPALSQDQVSNNLTLNLFEGLTEYDPKDNSPIPALASSWDVSPDGITYTFHLRPEAKWSDGSALTASDFVYSWRRVVDPNTASRYAQILYVVKNAEAINTAKITDLTQLGVTALDEHTLKVELEHTTPYFTALTNFPTYRPVKKDVIEKFDNKWTKPENMVCNGPFMLKEWIPQKQVVLVKNPYYWDAANVKLDKVVALAGDDLDTSLKLFQAGQIDFLYHLPPAKIPEIKATSPDFHPSSLYATYYLSLNVKKAGLTDKRVRQALNYAIDRDKLVQLTHRGLPSGFFVTPSPGYTPAENFKFDPDKARQLFAAAGYVNPSDFPTLTISYNTNEAHKVAMEVVQSMLRENLGINVQLQNMEFKVLLSARANKDFEISRDGWTGDYADPSTFMELMMSGGTNNNTNWGNEQYDALVREAAATMNQSKRQDLYRQAEHILVDEAPIVVLYTYTGETMLNKRVSGFYPTSLDMHPLKFVSVAPKTMEASAKK